MKRDIIKIAWRNLWRNKRRTLITASSIFFAIFIAIIMRSFQLGTYNHMIEQSVESYSGYLQIQNPHYFNDPSINNSFQYSGNLEKKISGIDNIEIAVPRIESFALASNGPKSKGVLITGINPEKEKHLSNPEHKLVKYKITDEAIKRLSENKSISSETIDRLKKFNNQSYSTLARLKLDLQLKDNKDKATIKAISVAIQVKTSYLENNDDGILVSDRLSKYLQVEIGDTVILIGQGYHGVSAAGIYPVRGIVKVPSPDLDNKLIYMTIDNANTFLGMQGNITSLAINLIDPDEMKETQQIIKSKIDNEKYTVKNWQELIPTLKQQIEGDNASGQIMLAILYVIVFFGIFGTVLMMISERKREFAMMVAIGMKRKRLSTIVSFEMLFLGLVGAVSGMIASIPIIINWYYNPIRLGGDLARMMEDMGFDPVMPMAWFDGYFYMQGLIILIMVILACWFPLRSILKLNVIKALRS